MKLPSVQSARSGMYRYVRVELFFAVVLLARPALGYSFKCAPVRKRDELVGTSVRLEIHSMRQKDGPAKNSQE